MIFNKKKKPNTKSKKTNKKKQKKSAEISYKPYTELIDVKSYIPELGVFLRDKTVFMMFKPVGKTDPNAIVDKLLKEMDMNMDLQVLITNYGLQKASSAIFPKVADDLRPLLDYTEDQIKAYNEKITQICHNYIYVIAVKEDAETGAGAIDRVVKAVNNLKALDYDEAMDLIAKLSKKEYLPQDPNAKKKVSVKKMVSPVINVKDGIINFKTSAMKVMTIQVLANHPSIEIATQLMGLSDTMICSIYFKKVDIEKCKKALNTLQYEYEKEIVNKRLSEGKALYHATIIFANFLDKDGIDDYIEKAETVGKRYCTTIDRLDMQQKAGYQSLFPFAKLMIKNYKVVDEDELSAIKVRTIKEHTHGCIYGHYIDTKKLLINERTTSGFILTSSKELQDQVIMNELLSGILMYPDDKFVVISRNPEKYYNAKIPVDYLALRKLNNFGFITDNPEINANSLEDMIFSIIPTDDTSRINYKKMLDSYNTMPNKTYEYEEFKKFLTEYNTPEAKNVLMKIAENNYQEFFVKQEPLLTNKINLIGYKDCCFSSMKLKMILDTLLQYQGLRIYIPEGHLLAARSDSMFTETYMNYNKNILMISGKPTALLKDRALRNMIKQADYINLLGMNPIERTTASELIILSKDQLNFLSDIERPNGILYTSEKTVPYRLINL